VMTDPDIPLLPPFPAGGEKAENMRTALAAEGEEGAGAARLLDTYTAQEEEQ
ncbi:MAG: thiamine pyrophosphate-requiring protein, partial [Arthrobacter sp.]|nr:thiamine pyrophosphate-requiring protein [Arthrobacter sp.]